MAEKKTTKKKTTAKKAAAPKTVKKAVPKKTVVKKTAVKKLAPKAEPLPDVLQKAVKFLDDKKAENIVALDMNGLGGLYDYFVIATAANAPHLKALGDGLQRLYKNEHYKGFRAAGTGDSGWVIVDYDGIMVHIFSFEMRNLYDLEKLWKDAPRVPLA
jgi:ribosome-associated protein